MQIKIKHFQILLEFSYDCLLIYQASHMADFRHLQSIQTVMPVGGNSSKVSVQLKVAGNYSQHHQTQR